MSENRIAYTSRTYDDYKKELISLTRTYYPDLFDRINDASIGNWLINVLSDIGDNLNYHIDRTYQETNIDSASQMSSLMNIARTNGLKIPGRKSAVCEIEFSCNVPLADDELRDGDLSGWDEKYCPIIRRGTLFSNGTTTFELMEDINFAEQFNAEGISDRKIEPVRNSNGNIIEYKLTKLAVVWAGQSKVYKRTITGSDLKPFFEIKLQDNNILGVESIIVKQGTNFSSTPLTAEFFVDEENYWDHSGNKLSRFFEVQNLADQYRFGYETERTVDGYYNPVWDTVWEQLYKGKDGQLSNDGNPNDWIGSGLACRYARGQWKRLKNKFITEYDDDWNLKIIFGAGLKNEYGEIPDDNVTEFTQHIMSRMNANDYMGVLPEPNSTIYIMYRVGGGVISNIAERTLNSIIYTNYVINGNCNDQEDARKKKKVRDSFKVTNTSPSYGGKDEPNEEEIRYLIKYTNASQNRCVTLHDYKAIINELPAKFGCPFRIGLVEENNKISIYTLGLNSFGKLSSPLSEYVANNIANYLSKYKMMNDYIEIKSGKIINIKFELTVYVDKSYEKSEVVKRIINEIYEYMDIRKHEMGEDIFLGDLQKNISQQDGVINIAEMKCFNMVGGKYSEDEIAQELIDPNSCYYLNMGEDVGPDNAKDLRQIDLGLSDMILYGNSNSMYEILDKSSDIIINVKTR